MKRRSFFAILAAAASGMWASFSHAAATKPTSDDEKILRLLQDNGIINKDMTWEKINQISTKLGQSNPNAGEPGKMWALIVKGKFIYRDDAK